MRNGNGVLAKAIVLWLVRLGTAFVGAAGLWAWTDVNRQLVNLHAQVSALQTTQATQGGRLTNIEDDLDLITRRQRTRN